jgi:hypothetical protein
MTEWNGEWYKDTLKEKFLEVNEFEQVSINNTVVYFKGRSIRINNDFSDLKREFEKLNQTSGSNIRLARQVLCAGL